MILSALVVADGITPEKADLSKNSLLVVGSEAHGISQRYLEDCWQKITLSMPGNTESLNAAIAGAHIITIPPQFLTRMADHKFTRETVRQFVDDAQKALEMMQKVRGS